MIGQAHGQAHGHMPYLKHGFDSVVVPPSGSGSLGVCIVGEAPGEQEARYGEGFYRYAPAGAMLERALKRVGISRDQLTLTNVVWQRPPRNWLEGAPWEREAVQHWWDALDDIIARTQPRVIVPLGNVALRRFTPYGGKDTSITAVRGYASPCPEYSCWVVPSLHPSFIQRGMQHLTGVLIRDLFRALEITRNGHAAGPVNYITHPSLDDALAFESGYDPAVDALSFDIETPESSTLDEEAVEELGVSYTILRVSFCYHQRYAITMPWMEPFITVIKRLLASPGRKRVWNENFDVPRLIANGAPIQGPIEDCMWLWKHIQPTLPRSLGFVAPFYGWDGPPWKHESQAEPERYSCADADALQRIGDGIDANLEQMNLTVPVRRYVIEVSQVLHLMSENGLPVNRESLAEFRAELQAKLDARDAELQTHIPVHLLNVMPKAGYVRPPKDTTGMIERDFPVIVKGDDGVVRESIVRRWCRPQPFLYDSWQQIARYAEHKGHKLGTNHKTGSITTDEDSLRKALKKHNDDVYRLILECRSLNKVISTYIDGWTPGADGLIHATPGFWGKMYRISWRKPNLAATIADKGTDDEQEQIAVGFRKRIEAPAGHWIMEGDWSGIEAVLVGWFAEDPEYIRLARLGVHSFMAGIVLKAAGEIADAPSTSWSDADLLAYKREIKKHFPKAYDDAKHGVHLSAYLGTPFLMTAMFPKSWPRQRDAAEWQELFFSTIARNVRAWQKRVLEQAHRQAFLTNPFGFRMYFWDVMHWDSKQQRDVLGEDAKSAVSFLPRDTAAFILRDTLLRLRDWAEDGRLRACVHDSLVSIQSEIDGPAERLRSEMERPVPELNGLVINAEIKFGRDWSDQMETWRG